MSDMEIIHMLGYLYPEKWADAIKIARNDKQSGLSENRLWELIKEQEETYSFNLKEDVEELL